MDAPPFATHDIHPDVRSHHARAQEAALQASMRAGNLFAVRAPSLAEIAAELGVPLWVEREVAL